MSFPRQFYLIPPVVLTVAGLLLTSCAERANLLAPGQSSMNDTAVVSGSVNKPVDIWFVKANQDQLQLVRVGRPISSPDTLTAAVQQLLQGPTSGESSAGLASEIPRGTILLGVKKIGNDYEVNVSHRFAVNSGASSMQTRIAQLSKTVAAVAGTHKVYLAVEGQRLNETPGDGLEVKQPLN